MPSNKVTIKIKLRVKPKPATSSWDVPKFLTLFCIAFGLSLFSLWIVPLTWNYFTEKGSSQVQTPLPKVNFNVDLLFVDCQKPGVCDQARVDQEATVCVYVSPTAPLCSKLANSFDKGAIIFGLTPGYYDFYYLPLQNLRIKIANGAVRPTYGGLLKCTITHLLDTNSYIPSCDRTT